MRGVLGEYISYNLSWTKDVSKQCSKVNKMLGFIRFIINTRPSRIVLATKKILFIKLR